MQNWNKFLFLIWAYSFFSCSPNVEHPQAVDALPAMYPDYTNITIPKNLAPLNFMVLEEHTQAVCVKMTYGNDTYTLKKRGAKICFPLSDWKDWTTRHSGAPTQVQLFAKIDGIWQQYPIFTWEISSEEIDSYLTYRLIEPGYEVWHQLQICERNLTSFDTKILAHYGSMNNRCMNCHIHGGNEGQFSLFYVRGEGGGTFLNRGNGLEKVILKSDQMQGATVYGDIHPEGRYGVFSTNVIMPSFHSSDARRLEVYDTTSDLCIADFQKQSMILSPLVTDSIRLETFPTFSADGSLVYFCGAQASDSLPDKISNLHYSLCSIGFNAQSGEWGTQIDTLWNARTEGGSANLPKASPDGKFLLFTRSDYGTFPIWHQEADLYLLNLQTGETQNLGAANSIRSDTYHTWSHNSHWVAFASKRSDGQYGRVYFTYIDSEGNSTKAFVLPQKDPEHDLMNLKSYNIPDLSTRTMPYDEKEVARLFQREAVQYK